MFSPRKSMSTYQSTQRSSSLTSSSVIQTKRGFKPSDRFDPSKKTFLVDLSKQIWKKRVFTIQLYFWSFKNSQAKKLNFLIAGPEVRGKEAN